MSTAAAPPVSHYARAETHRIEQERLLWAHWVSVARSEDLAEPGDFVTFDHAGEPLLVTRDREGVLRAFPNLCRHRGTTLAEGCGRTKSFQCPYHLWTYDLCGRLVGAPGMEGYREFERADHGLPELAVDCWGGWVFVHLDPDAAPLRDALPHLETSYPGAYLERLVRVARTRSQQSVNWKIVVENFIESYHHAGTHPRTLQPPYPYQRIHELDPLGEPWGSIEHEPAEPGLEPFTATSIYPTHLFAITRPTGVTWFRMEIPAHDRVDIDVQLLLVPELADDAALVEQSLAIVDAINAEDERVNRRTAAGLRSRYAVLGPLSPWERGLGAFRAWMQRALSSPSSSGGSAR